MGISDALNGGEVNLYDLDVVRSETMGRMLQKTPEQKISGTEFIWGTGLEQALEGADAVAVIMPAGPETAHLEGRVASHEHGFIHSDNVSPSGSFCGIRIAGTIMEIARKMEVCCPDALLLNFVNPAAVLSGMVNNHTKIRALGLCQGFTNHLWDIGRIFGKDEQADSLDVETAGVNHLSFITKGSYRGRDLFECLDEVLTDDWRMCDLRSHLSEWDKQMMTASVTNLVRVYKKHGALIFSTEFDGMAHLMHDEALQRQLLEQSQQPQLKIDELIRLKREVRVREDRSFKAYLGHELNDAFWKTLGTQDHRLARADNDVFVRAFMGLSGPAEVKLVASSINRGAISGMKDRYVAEFTQYISKGHIRSAQPSFSVPDAVQGLTTSLASYQTMLGDALATQDPRLLAQSLLAYPIGAYTQNARSLYKQLFQINDEYMPEPLRAAVSHL